MQFRRGSGVARHLGWLYAVIGMVAAPTLQAADATDIEGSRPRVLYFEPLPALRAWADEQPQATGDDTHTGIAAKTQSLVRTHGEHSLSFEAYGRRFDLSLETNARLSEALQSKSSPSSLSLYRGTLDGSAGSWVRLAAKAGEVHGMIWDGTDLYVIEPAHTSDASFAASNGAPRAETLSSEANPAGTTSNSAAGDTNEPSTPVIFRLADVLMEPGATSCAVRADPAGRAGSFSRDALEGVDPDTTDTGGNGRGDAAYGALLRELKGSAVIMQAAGATRRLTLSALGDASLLQRYLERGLNTQDAQDGILIRLNNVDGIYSTQLAIELRVDAVSIDHSLGNVLPDPVQPRSLLDELGTLRANSPAHRSHGLTHLFTGRDLEGTTVGIAYVDSLCSSRHGAALTQAQSTPWQDTLVAAHEIGHNFGAPHDGDPAEACHDAPPDHLMASAINGSDTFSQCSLAQMNLRAQAASCISTLPPANITIARDLGTTQQVASRPFEWQLEVRNAGGLVARNVRAELLVPPAMTIDHATVIGGSCTSGAGWIQCQMGDIAGGTSRTVVLGLHSDTPGTHSIAARVDADQDAQSWDNTGDGTITIVADGIPASQAQSGNSSGGGSMSMTFLLGLLGTLVLRARGRGRVQPVPRRPSTPARPIDISASR